MEILALLFFITTAVCAVGWLSNKISVLSLAWYLVEKNISLPTKEDIHRCTHSVITHMIQDITHQKVPR